MSEDRSPGSPREQVALYCDGSCLGNPGPGGWAALLVMERIKDGGAQRLEKLVVGREAHTTNNRMEITAAARGLQALKRACSVTVVTDSNYVVKGMREWRFGWVKRGWKNSQNKPVENRDLWEELIRAAESHHVEWRWVKGHAGHPENERVDAAAQAEAQRARS